MSTFAQETTNDLKLEAGQLVLVTDPAEAAAVQLRNRFQFVKGEYFLDTREGVPYFAYVFVKNPDLLLIKQLFRTVILSTPGIKDVLELTTSYDSSARNLEFGFRALTETDEVISGGSGAPFIVEPS